MPAVTQIPGIAGTSRRRALLLVAGWVVAVVAAGWLSWTAIDAAGRQVVGPVVPAGPASSATPSPAVSPSPTESPSTSATSATSAETSQRTVSTRGGTLAASCPAGAASVLYATPADGWRVEVEQEGVEAHVDFRRGEDRVRVRLDCAASQLTTSVEED